MSYNWVKLHISGKFPIDKSKQKNGNLRLQNVMRNLLYSIFLIVLIGCGGDGDIPSSTGGGDTTPTPSGGGGEITPPDSPPTPTSDNPSCKSGNDEVQIDGGGKAIGIGVPADKENIFSMLAETTSQGTTLTIVPGSLHSQACGTAIGSGCHEFFSGSQIIWDALPRAGQDLSGSITFVLDSGTFVGTISIPSKDIFGSPYQVRSLRSCVDLQRQ